MQHVCVCVCMCVHACVRACFRVCVCVCSLWPQGWARVRRKTCSSVKSALPLRYRRESTRVRCPAYCE